MKLKLQIFISAGFIVGVAMLIAGFVSGGPYKLMPITLGVMGIVASMVLAFAVWRGAKKGKSH